MGGAPVVEEPAGEALAGAEPLVRTAWSEDAPLVHELLVALAAQGLLVSRALAAARPPIAPRPPIAGRDQTHDGHSASEGHSAPGGLTAGLGAADGHQALDWAASGLMWLTGSPDRAPVVLDAPVLGRAAAAARVFAALSAHAGHPVHPDVAELLAGRAALLGLHRRGTWSTNGTCRLLPTADGWIAVNLARPHDRDAVGALIGALGGPAGPAGLVEPGLADPSPHAPDQAWAALGAAVSTRSGGAVVDLARLLAMPVSRLPDAAAEPSEAEPGVPVRVLPVRGSPLRPGDLAAPPAAPLVVDLSAMWAGPLCAHLLGRMGMRVVKVESVHRPDGARLGDPAFYDWLHAGHASVALDFATVSGRAALHRLVDQADVVIEASRPRALAQLGLDAAALVAARPGLTWVSITGYGRMFPQLHPGQDPVAFGDDAAVAGGLVGWERSAQGGLFPVFCADAVADPLTGLYAALAVAASRAVGGGHLLDVALREVAAFVSAPPPEQPPPERSLPGGPPAGRPLSGRGSAPHRRGPTAPGWSPGLTGAPWTVTGSEQAGWVVHQAGVSQRVLRPRPPRTPDVAGSGRPRAAALGADTRTVLGPLGIG